MEPNAFHAGKVIERHIRSQGLLVSAWARTHGFAPTTMMRVCSGYYNPPQWASLALLARIASEMYEDENQQRYFLLEVFAATGLIPNAAIADATAAVVRCEHQLIAIKRHIGTLAATARSKARKDQARLDNEPKPSYTEAVK